MGAQGMHKAHPALQCQRCAHPVHRGADTVLYLLYWCRRIHSHAFLADPVTSTSFHVSESGAEI